MTAELIDRDPSPGGLRLAPSDGEAPWPVVARVGPDGAQVAVYSLWPDDVATDRRDAVMRLVTEANLDRDIGAVVSMLLHHDLSAMDQWWDALGEAAGAGEAQG